MRLKNILPAFLLPVLTACSPVKLLNVITPSSSFSLAKDVSYGALERQKLDIYKPEAPRAQAPIIMFVHGGSWSDGNKSLYKFVGDAFASEGFTTVVPDYRLYPEARYPDFIVDVAEAVSFTAKRYPDQPLIVMGHSAGGYNVLMAALDKTHMENTGVSFCDVVSGVVSFSGPTGIVPLVKEPYITIFPDRFTGTDAPLNIVTGGTPPMLFLHGGKDDTVYPRNSEELAQKIKSRGGQADVKIYADMNHTDVVKVLSRHFDGDSTLKADILSFIDAQPNQRHNFCR